MLVSKNILEMAKRENERYYEGLETAKLKHNKKIEFLYERYKRAVALENGYALNLVRLFDEKLPASMLDCFSEREICLAINHRGYEFMLEKDLLEYCGVDCEGYRLYTPVWR